MKKQVLSLILVGVLAAASISGCGNSNVQAPVGSQEAETASTVSSEGTGEVQADSDEKEAPMLAEQVSKGMLPSVAERLPKAGEAMIETMESVGNYGGSFAFSYPKAGWNTGKPIEEGLFRFKEDGTVEPNVAKGYEVNEDATEYTIYLREGMKWSDGVPFTADDCVFFYDKMCVPKTFGKSLYDCFKVTNPDDTEDVTEAVFTKVDDYTFKVSFQYPKTSFIENLAINAKWCYAPKHYHETLLPEFIGEEAALKKAQEMGFSDVEAMGKETGYYFWNVAGLPTLNPYILSTEPGKNDVNGDYYEYVRNPYYWKVDEAGKQLPYIDKIEYTRIADESQKLMKALDGSNTISNEMLWTDIATLQENAEKSGYRIVQWDNALWASQESQLELNQTVKDEDYRALFQNKDFRQALSIAVDREEYSKLISDGWAEGKQAAPAEGLLGYNEEWSKKWTEYDSAKAKSLIEGCGMTMGTDGYYDFANGKDFVLNITTYTEANADRSAELLMKYYGDAGIKTTYKPMNRDLLNNTITSNDHEAVLSPVAPAEGISIILRPDTLVPVRNYAEWYGWVGKWYDSKGKEGVEPEGDLKALCQLYDELKTTVDADKQQEIAKEMLKLHEENIWVIGYMEALPTLYVVDSNLRNFKEESIFCDEFRGLGITHLQCCYFAQ